MTPVFDPERLTRAVVDGSAGVVLRGHDDGALHRNELGERKLDVARPRWHVDDQKVELTPVDVR